MTESGLTLDKMLLYIRGGSIFARKDIARRSTASMKFDPLTLVIALNKDKQANGSVYIDDGDSYEYEEKQAFARVQFEAKLENDVLKLSIDVKGMSSLLSKNLLQSNRIILIQPSGNQELKVDLYLGDSGEHQYQV